MLNPTNANTPGIVESELMAICKDVGDFDLAINNVDARIAIIGALLPKRVMFRLISVHGNVEQIDALIVSLDKDVPEGAVDVRTLESKRAKMSALRGGDFGRCVLISRISPIYFGVTEEDVQKHLRDVFKIQ